MAHVTEGSRIWVDPVVLDIVVKTNPPGMSRTAWVNYLIQVGAANVQKTQHDAA